VTQANAEELAATARAKSDFPVVVNEAVLQQLNRYLGTEQGREFLRRSLARMESSRPMLDEKFAKYRAPRELLAVGIVESGFQNLPAHRNPIGAAGIWQFIASTARIFGMRVDDQLDERLDEVKETEAALRYLTMNYLRFQDWQLAFLAYNMGEENLQKAIEKTGTWDAWELIRRGHEGDKNYLAKVMAAVLILQNPELFR
jgi:membrane-bound lytic murein transglycosylase D